jgi:hypothetical protein
MKARARNDRRSDKAFGYFGVEKKKSVMALGLVAVMVFMWARVLSRRAPEAAAGASQTKSTTADASLSNSQLKISFIELPKVKGRNDVLAGDFFTCVSWRDFMRGREGTSVSGSGEVKVVSKGSDERVRMIADRLRLQAIGLGRVPQAYINDKLRSVGDKFLINDGGDAYECEVVGVEENRVLIRSGDSEITLKLGQVTEGTN